MPQNQTDGGRDGKFVGTAERFPGSAAAPWKGTTIIQAKHTNGYNRHYRHFLESDFFSMNSRNMAIGKEISRIKKLVEAKQIDRYIFLANRRLSGNAETQIPELMLTH